MILVNTAYKGKKAIRKFEDSNHRYTTFIYEIEYKNHQEGERSLKVK